MERREALNKIASELGDPDASMERFLPTEESPLAAADFSARPIAEVVAFLRSWRPKEAPQRQTVTALAQELHTAVYHDPETYAANADQFSGLKPIYTRRVLEGLRNAASNQRNFPWGKVLKLVEFTYAQFHQTIDPSSIAEGDDPDWTWACLTASELLAAGLRRGASGVEFEHQSLVRSLVFSLIGIAPKQPELEDFEERYQREPFFGAQATSRGMAVELCILLMYWLSKDASSPFGGSGKF